MNIYSKVIVKDDNGDTVQMTICSTYQGRVLDLIKVIFSQKRNSWGIVSRITQCFTLNSI